MLKRKIIATLLATPLSLLFIFAVFFGEWSQPLELLGMSIFYSFFVSPFYLLYGLPITFLSDYIGKRLLGKKRIIQSFVIHVLFGALFGLFFPSHATLLIAGREIDTFVIFGSISGVSYWIIDEMLRCCLKNGEPRFLSFRYCLNKVKP
ncbi:hypothetical protein [Radiobacillus deserti]|nr:hypothetical protein [Radiobacillus deserti]